MRLHPRRERDRRVRHAERRPDQRALQRLVRLPGCATQCMAEQPDPETFPAIQLGYEVARRGGTCGAVLNAANEAAVGRFLAGELPFLDIPRACREILNAHNDDPRPTLSELLRQDAWAREEMRRWTC